MSMKNKRPIVINLISGPCAGKSTTAAGVFYELKKRGINCEMSLEFAKDKVWEESFKTMDDQIYIFGKQYHKLWRLKDKVDVIITDSPLIISLYYNKDESRYFNDFVVEQYNRFDNRMYFIERNDEYDERGRMQTKEEAEAIDVEIKNILDKYNIDHCCVENKYAVNRIVSDILTELNIHTTSAIFKTFSDKAYISLVNFGYEIEKLTDVKDTNRLGFYTDAPKNKAYVIDDTMFDDVELDNDVWVCTNEDMFLAVTALSDGHDKNQWFILDTNVASPYDIDNCVGRGTHIKCDRLRWAVDLWPDNTPCDLSSRNTPAHKASIYELYDIFENNKEDVHTNCQTN